MADTEHADALRQMEEAALEADAAAARLRAWFEDTKGPMVMDEADFDDVLTVLNAYDKDRAALSQLRPEYGARVTYTDTLTAEGPIGDDAGEARARAADLAENSAVVSVILLQRPVGDWQNVERGDDRG